MIAEHAISMTSGANVRTVTSLMLVWLLVRRRPANVRWQSTAATGRWTVRAGHDTWRLGPRHGYQSQGRVFHDAGDRTALHRGYGTANQHVGPLDCSDGQVLHDWCLRGMGIAWRSTWEVEREVAEGQLVALLADFTAPPNGIYAVFPQRKHLPLRVRLWIDFIKLAYGEAAYWGRAARQPLAA
jgi:DNA-binding transcriptional LysR family regulator